MTCEGASFGDVLATVEGLHLFRWYSRQRQVKSDEREGCEEPMFYQFSVIYSALPLHAVGT